MLALRSREIPPAASQDCPKNFRILPDLACEELTILCLGMLSFVNLNTLTQYAYYNAVLQDDEFFYNAIVLFLGDITKAI